MEPGLRSRAVEDEAERAESAPIFDDELLTVEDVAKWLRLNKMMVRNMINRGELGAIYLGQRRVRIRRSELERFLAAGETGRHTTDNPKPIGINDAMASVLHAADATEMVTALRALAAAAERLASAIEEDADR
jgi:excisionase family DNA binding protein